MNIKQKIVSIALVSAIAAANIAASSQTTKQQKLHQIAEIAREIGIEESSSIITEASRLWWEEENNKQAAATETVATCEVDEELAVMLAKTVWCEARGIESVTQQSAIIWCILNRADSGGYGDSVRAVLTAPYQFAYREWASTTDDYGRDLVKLAMDVLTRWEMEKAGETDVGRTLPKDYMWYSGNGKANVFRNKYSGNYQIWDWSLPSPYES